MSNFCKLSWCMSHYLLIRRQIITLRIRYRRIEWKRCIRHWNRYYLLSIWVNIFNCIVLTINIHAPTIILIRHRIHHMPSTQRCIIHSRPIIIPIQSAFSIQFFSVVLVGLNRGSWSKDTAKRIIMIHFFHYSILRCNHTIVTLMIL